MCFGERVGRLCVLEREWGVCERERERVGRGFVCVKERKRELGGCVCVRERVVRWCERE